MVSIQKKIFFFTIILLILSSNTISTISQGTSIIIDGDLSDWEGLEPVLVDEENQYWMDIQTAYISNDTDYLYFRVDYAQALDFPSLFANVTLEIPNGSVYVLFNAIYFENELHSHSAIFKGSTIDNPYNNETYPFVEYHTLTAVDLNTNKTIEFAFPLEDMGLQSNDTINVIFWHYDNIAACSHLSTKIQSTSQDFTYRRYPEEGFVSYIINATDRVFNTSNTDSSSSSNDSDNNSETGISMNISIFALITLGIIVKKKKSK